MKITFLGNRGSVQSKEAGNVSLLIAGEQSLVLVDVNGAPAQLVRQGGYDPLDLDVIVLTHGHVDHLYGLPSLIHNLWLLKRTRVLTIVANDETRSLAQALCDVFALDTKPGMFPLVWKSADEAMTVGDLTLECFSVDHGIPTCGICCTQGTAKFVYSADTRYMEDIPSAMKDASLLVHETGGIAEAEERLAKGGHSSGRQAALMARRSGAKRLLLCHLPFDEQSSVAILDEARATFALTDIPSLFVPYSL